MTAAPQLSAVVNALRFHGGSVKELKGVHESDWPRLLDATDAAHLTTALGVRCREALPESVRARIDRNLADNAARYDRLLAAQSQIVDAMGLDSIRFVVLKGLAQWPWYCDDPRQRPQYDIDLYLPAESIAAAASMVRKLRYEPAAAARDPGADHLPVMIRKTGWTWQGNYYDPDMPPSLELHDRFWNPCRMRFDVGDVAQFWKRRVRRAVGGVEFPTLDPVDGLSYSALHLVRHLLGGDRPLRHVYEMAHFLERSADEGSFWAHWRRTGLKSCRVMEGIAFRLASEWFHCRLHSVAQEAVDELPPPIQRWFSLFAVSRLLASETPDKNELWLHLSLLHSGKDKLEVARRRLLPTSRARVTLDAHVDANKATGELGLRRAAYEASFLTGRALHHLESLAPTIRGAYLWYSGRRV